MTVITNASRRLTWLLAAIALVVAMGGTWMTSATANAAPAAQIAARADPAPQQRSAAPRKKKNVAGKLNLNTATEDELMMLPTVGPAKAERIVTWRKKNGGFKRIADLRRVKGFGYKTFKRLEPLLDVRGETTLAPK
jgi:competence protein ComEA